MSLFRDFNDELLKACFVFYYLNKEDYLSVYWY
ncbi:hypothetical protein BCO_0900110 (plasmid) [Borrelia coriaceae ATCC 43381]|uniref:Uncharacterized protein n=1 Tax=Borrelia coriaceae ATCC 43381 TaxID=1408429 RepID=W5SY21_9SPIR|nr:hypothetical protein BCO_0900110 [Borrelia coriaceae ATCC 43381]